LHWASPDNAREISQLTTNKERVLQDSRSDKIHFI
jgi:hypothetical protein